MRFMVSRLRNGLAELFALPDGYEVMLGNGGSTVFWDIATFGLIEHRSQHLSFGEFSSKFAAASAAAPFLDEPGRRDEPIPAPTPTSPPTPSVDVYALTHNETSTGVAMPLARPEGADRRPARARRRHLGRRRPALRPAETDVYYFAPQKCLASDGGLWLAAVSPAAIERIERIGASDRWIPAVARASPSRSRTPARTRPTTRRRWPRCSWPCSRSSGSTRTAACDFAAGRSDRSAEIIYGWAEAQRLRHAVRGRPGAAQPRGGHHRPRRVDRRRHGRARCCGPTASSTPSSYRKLGRNQLRVALFPAIDPDDVAALTACIDHVVANLA